MALLKINQPPAIRFWYRESPDNLIPLGGSSITRTEPPLDSGMLRMLLDSDGTLIQFDARPPAQGRDRDQTQADGWNRLLVSAGVDATAHLTVVQPRLIAPVVFDSQAAWVFATPQGQYRLEAAAYQSRPVFFRRAASWIPTTDGPRRTRMSFSDFFVGLVVLASLLAWRNVRFGKHDQRGAFRLACFAFACTLIRHLSETHHVPSLAEADLLYRALRESLANAALFWVLYLGFEPYARRRWPTALVSWSRLLGGELRDPMLGSDVLCGTVLGVAGNLILAGAMLAAPFSSYLPWLAASTGSVFSLWSYLLLSGVASGLSFMFFLVLLRRLVRPAWLAGLTFIVLVSLLYSPSSGPGLAIILSARTLLIIMAFYCLTRFGVLCTVTWFCILLLLIVFPITTDASVWYFQHGLLTALGVLALAIYAFRMTLAGRPLWQKQWDVG
jgi:serine/threonine-protein kinase